MRRPIPSSLFVVRVPVAASAVLAACILSACAVGPDYQTPATATPERFAGGQSGDFSAQAVTSRWWRLFNDELLQTLVDETLRHNHDLEAARANLREARALYLEAGLNLAPNITTHANHTDQQRSMASLNNRNFVPRDLNLYNLGFDASWELDIFGRARRNIEARSNEVEAQEAGLREIGLSLIAEVARNYFELRGLQQQLQVTRRNIDNQQQTLDITRVRLENGRGTELDYERAKAQLDASRAAVPPLETALSYALHRLSVLTGQWPDALTTKLTAVAQLPALPEITALGQPADLLRRRMDIRIAERQLAAATAQIGVATADLFPRVTFVGNVSLEASTLSGIGAAGSGTYSVGPRISWAAFTLNTVMARIKAADARAESDLAHYQQTVLNALEETENSLVNYSQAKAKRDLLASSAAANRKAHQLAHLRFNEGVSDFLTVLDSETRLLQAESQLAESQTAVATALVAVYKALGGGWESADPQLLQQSAR